ncbi:Diacylglycerol kinase [Cinnamomum micranthum f. kanehirae]|uniref:sphingosine kinase n=1 Tax=Cinnamomum micranthum f. kanehirae TaxID=337451 RepID=A0A3S3R0T0_9MAGN|nr:Diacylglycerol kinase [Cinnamomum micranthum f. kanehirae]
MELAPETESLTLAVSEQIRVDGTLTEASLSTDGKIRWKTESGERRLAIESEVLGFSAEGSRIRVRALVQREGWCCGDGGGGNRARKDLVLEPMTEESKIAWCGKLREFIDSLDRPKKLFILVNPFGGKKCALKLFHKQVKPLLAAADIQYTLQETQYQLHAKEIVNSLDLSKYDGIVCVSGDGVLVEVVNGLLQRGDWDAAIKMPLGIVPAGTGNGMIKSLLDSVGDAFSVSNAIFSVIRGHKRSLDVATVLQGETRFFSVLMLTWGLVADIDIESEKYRWMGSSRLEFYGILRVICLRKYHGCISFVPAPGYETYGDPIDQKNRWSQKQDDNSEVQQCGYQGPITCLENMEWKIIQGPFISVWLHNVPWASEDTMPAPNAKFADGYLDLIIIRDCPKSALLSMLTKLSDGDHVKSPYVLYLKVKAFRLEPGQRVGEPTKGGIIDSDGEVLARGERTYKCEQVAMMAYGPIQMTVDKGLATLFSPV